MSYAQTSHLIKSQNLLRDIFIILGTSVLFGLAAWISIPLPFTPVPISFTAQLILLFSVILGRKGAYATAAYILQGAIGLPVFCNGGCGIAHLLGPTGGYLVGFLVASYVVGLFSEKLKDRTSAKMFGLMALGNALMYVFGLPHLALFVGDAKALTLGLYPFIGTDILKLLLACRALKFFK